MRILILFIGSLLLCSCIKERSVEEGTILCSINNIVVYVRYVFILQQNHTFSTFIFNNTPVYSSFFGSSYIKKEDVYTLNKTMYPECIVKNSGFFRTFGVEE